MTEQEYLVFLEKAPKDHFSNEFKLFLMNNNIIRELEGDWLIIENKKYWTKENDWLTAFYFPGLSHHRKDQDWALMDLRTLSKKYGDREWLIKAPSKRTVKVFHIHLIKKS